jgi:hypothetical protein
MNGPHPNRREFSGVLTLLETPSDRPPQGSRRHPVVISRLAAERSLETLLLMGVSEGHYQAKCGVITSVRIDGDELCVAGHLFERDCPEIVKQLAASSEDFGLSYEITECFVEDIRSRVWRILDCFFTGVAIVPKKKAAYQGTNITLSGRTE